MSMKQTASMLVQGFGALGMILLTGCGSTPGGRATVPVAPMCTMHAVIFSVNPPDSRVLVSERTNPNSNHGFTRFRIIAGPRGNTAVGFTPDVYGFSEAWSHNTAGSVVYRAQAHPARRGNTGPFSASAWSLNTQDATGRWSPTSRVFSAQRGTEQDSPPVGGMTVPQLMPVGLATPQVFGCAGERSQDEAVRTTWLIEATASNPATGTPGAPTIDFVQDLLSGDDRFVPNAPGPLRGPANPPAPRITDRPGMPVRDGTVQCAMTQFEDDVSTRELHMVAIRNGVLHHSMANNFGEVRANAGTGFAFNRFRTVSTWGDVGQALGGGFGNIIDVAVVARPRALHVFFVAQSGSSTRLWHAVRFSAGGGSWRPADDVLTLNGAHPSGAGFPFRIAAGLCPQVGQPQQTELVYTLWNDRLGAMWTARVVSTPQQWLPGLQGTYSPLIDIAPLRGGNATNPASIDSMVIGTRPFRDDARPPP